MSITFSSTSVAVRQWFSVPANQLFLLLLLLAAIPLFFDLGRTPVQVWDESRQAISAVEMARSGRWLVPTFAGQPDHWNTKPPLLIWGQVLFIKLLGYGTWALRLPSALAALCTVGLLYRFASHILYRPMAGFFAGLVLVTAVGYVRLHGARTGDYDALLAFWEIASLLAFFQYLESGRSRHLYWVGGALAAAVLTKGVAGLFEVPMLLIYALGCGKLGWLLRQLRFYAVAAASIAVVAAYYLLREGADPGYLIAVRENELGGRFNQVLDGHSGSWHTYFDLLYGREFENWIWWLIPAVVVWWQPDRRVRRAGSLLLVFVLGWLSIISAAATKLDWYTVPVFPPLALLIGLGLDYLYHDTLAANLPRLPRAMAWPFSLVLVAGVFYFPYRATMRRLVEERHSDYGAGSDAHLPRYLEQVMHSQLQSDTLTLLCQGGYNAALQYYQTVLGETTYRTINIQAHAAARQLRPGSVVLACDPAYRAQLDSLFQLETLHQEAPCETLRLLSRK